MAMVSMIVQSRQRGCCYRAGCSSPCFTPRKKRTWGGRDRANRNLLGWLAAWAEVVRLPRHEGKATGLIAGCLARYRVSAMAQEAVSADWVAMGRGVCMSGRAGSRPIHRG